MGGSTSGGEDLGYLLVRVFSVNQADQLVIRDVEKGGDDYYGEKQKNQK